MIREMLLALLDGSRFANALMPWGKPGPIDLPADPAQRAALVDAHLAGRSADVLYSATGHEPKVVHVEAVVLAGFCPAADGTVRWLGIDLDAADHGASGLADPSHAARCIAERAGSAGLLSGLIVAHSRGGHGRHVFVVLPDEVALDDAVVGVAALVAHAFDVASDDAIQAGRPHAFRRADGKLAEPGQQGAVEMFPRSSARPPLGWALALPAAGIYAGRGGGIIIDPFTGKPCELRTVPRCNAYQWGRFISEARARLAGRMRSTTARRPVPSQARRNQNQNPLDFIDPRTRDFIDGRIAEGGRNRAAFVAACNLLGVGVDQAEVERLIIGGAAACGLPAHEARAAFSSAIGARQRRGRV